MIYIHKKNSLKGDMKGVCVCVCVCVIPRLQLYTQDVNVNFNASTRASRMVSFGLRKLDT